jgi:hypothetical protein
MGASIRGDLKRAGGIPEKVRCHIIGKKFRQQFWEHTVFSSPSLSAPPAVNRRDRMG